MDFIKTAISADIRLDGRRLDEQYKLNVVPNISSIAHGSSQVTFGDNVVQTTVTVSLTTIQFSIAGPDDSAPDEGVLELSVCGTSIFEGSDQSQKVEDALCTALYDLQFDHGFLDPKSLCILPGHFCWHVRIHCTVVKRGGFLLDALSLGVLTALRCSEVPSVEVLLRDELESSADSSNLQVKLGPELVCLTLSKNPFLDALVGRVPLVTTVGKVADRFAWSLTRDEEACCEGTLSVAVDAAGRCLAVRAAGSCFDLASVEPLIAKSTQLAADNFARLGEFLSN